MSNKDGRAVNVAGNIRVARSDWADLDDLAPTDAKAQFTGVGWPKASILVNRGHGVHAYWLLNAPFRFEDGNQREVIERMLNALF